MNLHKHIGKTKKRENFYRTRYYEVMIDTKNQPFIPLYGLADDIKTTLLNLIHNSGEIPSDIYKPLDIKAGTQTDTKVKLKGKGVPTLRNKNVRGDHYVTLVVQVPDQLLRLRCDVRLRVVRGKKPRLQDSQHAEHAHRGRGGQHRVPLQGRRVRGMDVLQRALRR